MDLSFYRGKTVLVTGNTGFKGAWMSMVLCSLGAKVIGYSLQPPTSPSLFDLLGLYNKVECITGDIRDLQSITACVKQYKPEIVIHMAAQPIVRESYKNPVYTYETNVMGTVNILEAVRQSSCVASFLNVTTDKVYHNNEWEWGYRENDVLDGHDPYSNSKSCSELVTNSYKKSFLADRDVAISTARAGNVIGGGDFASDRIVPDCVRAAERGKPIIIRNPQSVRPYEHVLEPVCTYLLIAEKQYQNSEMAGNYNVGPDECDCVSTAKLASLFCKHWGDIEWLNLEDKNAPHEANFLKLDCSRLRAVFGWKPRWNIDRAVKKTVEWSKAYLAKDDLLKITLDQINEYLNEREI